MCQKNIQHICPETKKIINVKKTIYTFLIKKGDYQPQLTFTLPGSGRDSNTEHSGASLNSNPLHYQSEE